MSSSIQPSPFPKDLNTFCQSPPWRLSSEVFQKVQQTSSPLPYKKVEIFPNDPEYKFIYHHFHHNQPTNRVLKHVFCIHNERQNSVFENVLLNMELEAKNPVFQPKWNNPQDPQVSARQQVMQRFQEARAPFNPFKVWQNTFDHVTVLPLWHGTTAQKCDSICTTGFSYFGKHKEGNSQSTDIGFFGSGIYFTNSARYAADIYSDGQHLILAWVSLRSPYPVTTNKPLPQQGSDMTKLQGQGAYENYDAHYVPVVSLTPNDPKCAVYYPCPLGQLPTLDELVVFQKQQTLVRFYIEMQVDLTQMVSVAPATIHDLLNLIFSLAGQEEINSFPQLTELLTTKTQELWGKPETTPLTTTDDNLYRSLKRLPQGQKLNPFIVSLILKSVAPEPTPILPPFSVDLGKMDINPPSPKPLVITEEKQSKPHPSFSQIPSFQDKTEFLQGKQLIPQVEKSTIPLRNWKAEPKVHTLQGHTHYVSTLIELKDGTLASGSEDTTIKLWNRSGTCLHTLQGHTRGVSTLIELKDGTLASGSADTTIKLWNRSGTCLQTLQGHTYAVSTLIELKDGTLASGSWDKTIKLWNRSGTCLQTLQGHTNIVLTLIELKDGTLASGSWDETIKLWNRSGTCLHTLQGHTNSVFTLIELKDGTLASGSDDKTIKLWNRSGICLHTLQGHTGAVLTLIELKDGTLASGSVDKTIKLWNRSGTCLQTLQGHKSTVCTLIELKDGTLASGGYSIITLLSFPML